MNLSEADESAERDAAHLLLEACGRPGATVGGDKGYDTVDVVQAVRALGVTPHVAANAKYSALDAATT